MAQPRARITGAIDEQLRVTLGGNRHPLARSEYEVGPASPDHPMERMILVLDADTGQRKALDELMAEQQNPRSPRYHDWLTPESFGRQFGVSEGDLNRVVSWLAGHGLEVEEIPAGRRAIVFSGSVEQVESAFHTQIRIYDAGGQRHHANATDPEIPQALAEVVHGVAALHDFRSSPALAALAAAPAPQFTTAAGGHYMAPADFATIYHLAPLYQNSSDGTGQSIAVVARSNIALSDVRAFRSYFGLAANDPAIIVNGTDPGIVAGSEQSEATLDAEWAGAAAKNAAVQLVVSASTNASDGAYLSAIYIVNRNLAPVVTMSFELCEAALGSAGNALFSSLWQQAAAQGMTVLVASGDSGAAGCDPASAANALRGAGVNGLCSTPYSTCVGGTEFNDSTGTSQYWSSALDPVSKGSALGYIPETAWNDSGLVPGGSGLWATGGGSSTVYTKPAWQTGGSVPVDGRRDVPDVALSASLHDGYLIYMNGQLYAAGGTSAAAPSFAGLMALVDQKTGTRQGNANPPLYALASNQQAGGAAVFHDVATGNNTVPFVTGFGAGPGYDQATGLGSVDATVLVNQWTNVAPAPVPGLQLALSSPSVSAVAGGSASVTIAVGVSGGFSTAVEISAAGLPAGATASFAPATLAAPGSGLSALTLTLGPQVTPGSYILTVTAAGGSITQSGTLTLIATAPAGFTLALSTASVNIRQGSTGTAGVTVSVAGGFRSAVALAVAGIPAGMAASMVPAGFTSPGSGTGTIALRPSFLTSPGTYTISITASGGGIMQTAAIAVTVVAPPTFTISESTGSVMIAQGRSATVNLSAGVANGFNAALTLGVAGWLPAGLTAGFSPAGFPAPGAGTGTLTLNAAAQLPPGAYMIQITASGGGLTAVLPLVVFVVPPPGFTLKESLATVTVSQGSSVTLAVTLTGTGGFNAPVTLAVSGLRPGVTASFSPVTIPGAGTHTSTLKLTAAPNATAGPATFMISASGGGITNNLAANMTVTARSR